MGSSEDPLRPEHWQSSKILARSRSTWRRLLCSAQCFAELPSSCGNVKTLLNNTPSIPHASSNVIEFVDNSNLSLEGFSKWTVAPEKSSNPRCELPATKRALPRRVFIASRRESMCEISGAMWKQPISQGPHSPNLRGNYLSALILGWSYVLSARLIELRRKSTEDKLIYKEPTASISSSSQDSDQDIFELLIPNDDHAEVIWWTAVLASGRGWEATLTRDDQRYYALWETHLKTSPYRISCPPDLTLDFDIEPPSSYKARAYLIRFARVHDCFDQLIYAFAAALTIPAHIRFGASITLPDPSKDALPYQNSERQHCFQVPSIAEISHYMVLSGTAGSISSCLLGSFWEPGIPCNLASEWLNPPFNEIFPPFLQSKEYHTIVRAMSDRRPSLAPLWLGAAITGLLPRVFQVLQAFVLPGTCLEAAAWTASPQSFMDPFSQRPVHVEARNGLELISREDEFRLLFNTDIESSTYGGPPISPYPPFGRASLRDTALEIRLHLSCGHRLAYHSWNWKCQSVQNLCDLGMSNDSTMAIPKSRLGQYPSMLALAGVTIISFRKITLHSGILVPGILAIVCLLPASPRLDILRRLSTTLLCFKEKISAIFSGHGRNCSKFKRETFREDFSELSTRGVFSWTFFTDGVRPEEKPLWNHEWLEFLLAKQTQYDSSESSSSETETETNSHKIDRIQKWQSGIRESSEDNTRNDQSI